MRKIINLLMVFIVLLNLIPVTVFAENENVKTYGQNGYTINYEIVNSWGNSQNITVTIKNTGTETIDNWMLEYDFNGDVVGIWNAVTAIDDNGSEYIKNAGHNAVIEPDSSAVFGYTLENAKGFPDSIVMCQKESIKESGYNVELRVIDEWNDNFNGEIIITNMADDPIECWTLNFDSNFTIVEITDSWAASILSAAEGSYTLKGTYTNIIYGNSSAAIGFTGKKFGTPKIIDYTLTEVIKSDSMADSDSNPDLEDIGQIYFKDIQSEDDIEYDGNGIYYVRNQVLLTAKDNVSFDDIESLAETLNAEIVGYIELTNDYQIEFNSKMTTKELYQLIEELGADQLVEYTSLNTVIEIGEDYMPSDYDWWDGKNPENIDWGIKAIKADEAWEYFDESKEENRAKNSVKIGLIDTSFNESHNDLDFKYAWQNVDETNDENFHGTHVAGIMAATFGNIIEDFDGNPTENIAGICPKNELYAYASGGGTTSSFEYKYALAFLIANNVRVINISQNSGHEQCYGASNGNVNAINYIKTNAKIIEKFLKKLIDKKYDFLIVTTAGNVNLYSFSPTHTSENEDNDRFKKDDDYGYIKDLNGTKSVNADSLYNSFFNYIGSDDIKKVNKVKNRIICVGSIGHKYVNGNAEYYFDDETCIGSRVDVLAPGKRIYSAIPGNGYDQKTGTSMAAPHVAGIAGMMYSIDPSLKAEDVKKNIISAATQKISTPDNSYTYKLVDAKAAVDMVVGSGDYEEKTNGIVLGKVVEKVLGIEKNLKDVTVTVYENIDGEIKKAEDIKEEKTNEEGEYEFILPVGDYVLEYTKDRYVTYRENVTVTENFVKKIDDILLVEGTSISVKDEKSKEFLSDVKITVKFNTDDGFTENETEYETNEDSENEPDYETNESGEFVFKHPNSDYIITLVKDGYEDKILKVKAEGGLLYGQDNQKIDEILMVPIDIRIRGVVEKHNKKTSETTPLADHEVKIYKKSQSNTNETAMYIESAKTNSYGKYEFKLDSFGEYIVKFDDSNQKTCLVDSVSAYTVNMVFEVEEESAGNNAGNNNNNNANSGDSAESDNNDWINIGDNDLNIEIEDDGGTSFGNLSSGIWLKTFNGTENYYVHIYTTSDAGEYRTSFGAPGWGLCTTMYHNWTHKLMMATYKSDGTLINDSKLDYFYEETYIYLPDGYRPSDLTDSRPLMRIDTITSVAISSDGITYNIHTDGYYKEFYTIVGSVGVEKKDWEKDETKTIAFYNNSKCIGVSYKSPFESE